MEQQKFEYEGVQYTIYFEHRQLPRKRGTLFGTTCYIKARPVGDKEGQVVGQGTVKRNLEDRENRVIARTMSLKKAIASLDSSIREPVGTMLWEGTNIRKFDCENPPPARVKPPYDPSIRDSRFGASMRARSPQATTHAHTN